MPTVVCVDVPEVVGHMISDWVVLLVAESLEDSSSLEEECGKEVLDELCEVDESVLLVAVAVVVVVLVVVSLSLELPVDVVLVSSAVVVEVEVSSEDESSPVSTIVPEIA